MYLGLTRIRLCREKKEVTEHESVDVEHRTTHEHGDIEPEHDPALARDLDEQGEHEEGRREHRELRRESSEHEEQHLDD